MKTKVIIAAACAVAGLLGQARAGVVLSDLNQAWNQNQFIANKWAGNSFTTGVGSPNWSLDSLRARMWIEVGQSWAVDIYTDQGGNPGSVVGTLSQVGPGGLGGGDPDFYAYTFTPSLGLNLASNTTYWMITKPLGGATGNMLWITDPLVYDTQAAGWAFGPTRRVSTDSGATWTSANGVQRLEISATPVPEPQLLGLLASLGLLGFALARKRRV